MTRGFLLGETDRAARVEITEVPRVACLLFAPSTNKFDCINAVKPINAPVAIFIVHLAYVRVATEMVSLYRLDETKRFDWLINITQHSIAYWAGGFVMSGTVDCLYVHWPRWGDTGTLPGSENTDRDEQLCIGMP